MMHCAGRRSRGDPWRLVFVVVFASLLFSLVGVTVQLFMMVQEDQTNAHFTKTQGCNPQK
jgi:hypothetical protein